MKKLLITTALALSLSTSAYAFGNKTENNSNAQQAQGQIQGQKQGQGQSQSSYNKNSNKNRNSNYNDNYNRNSNYNKSTSLSGAASAANNANAVTNEVTVEGDNIEIPKIAAGASAPSLVAADDTCMGSTSVGGQGFTFGFSAGTTWRDEDCVRRKDARELSVMGFKKAAVALMCQDDKVKDAFTSVGKKCPSLPSKVASASKYDYPTGAGRRR